ncbi:radical SAM protein [bacterium]|nr:radical SAM protein [bacterium]
MKNNVIEKEFDLEKKVLLPDDIVYKKIDSHNLIISPSIPSWLTLEDCEKNIFDLIKNGLKPQEIVELGHEVDKVVSVLVKIDIKKFYRATKSTIRENLYSATLYLTNNCNLRCKHCYMFSGEINNEEIDVDYWKEIMKVLKSNGVKVVTFTGGEPLVKEGFYEILDFAYKNFSSVILLTNGTLINESNYNYIASRCREIQISLDGPSKELHEAIRGKGTYFKTINAIKLLSSTNSKIFIAMTPIPETIDFFEKEFPIFLRKNSFLRNDNIDIVITAELQNGRDIDEVKKTEGNDYFYNKVKKITDNFIGKNNLEKRKMLALVPGEKKVNCGFSESISIFWDGRIKSCYKDVCGLCFSKDLENGVLSTFMKFKFLKTNVDNLNLCRNCDLRYFCGGSCRVENEKKMNSMLNGYCDKSYKDDLYNLLIKFDHSMFSFSINL